MTTVESNTPLLSKKEKLKTYNKQYYLKNKERISEKYKIKYSNDENFREKKKTQVKNNYHAKKALLKKSI